MFESFKQTTDAEKTILRKLRVWIAALAAVCVLAGIGIGAILAGRTSRRTAYRRQIVLRSVVSFVEIARRAEPAVVNIDTTQVAEAAESDNEDRVPPAKSTYDMLSPAAAADTRSRKRLHHRSEGLHPDELSCD
jgi:hypothetical protein